MSPESKQDYLGVLLLHVLSNLGVRSHTSYYKA